jgi:uncharacterized protein (DUF433 family)
MNTTPHEHTSANSVGVYTLPEAARIVRMNPKKVKRLVQGYEWGGPNKPHGSSPPLFRGQYEEDGGPLNLSFLDLIELLFVRDFQRQGMSMHSIRRAAEMAATLFKDVNHPFCLRQFSTDGKDIFVTVADEAGDRHLLNLVKRQHAFDVVMKPFLKQLEYTDTGILRRWFPMGKGTQVVLDPSFSFGAPVVMSDKVPTSALYGAHMAGETDEAIAHWYEVPEDAVRQAIEYEHSLALPLAA